MLLRASSSSFRFAGNCSCACRYPISPYGVKNSIKIKHSFVPNRGYGEKKSQESARRDDIQQVSSEAQNVSREAVPFDRSLLSRLTPTMKSFTLDGKVAVITGGARGLGRNISQALAEAGASAIALLDLKQDLGEVSAASLRRQMAAGGDSGDIPVHFYKTDVRDAAGIADSMARVVRDLGGIDIVVNAAGVVDSNIKAETYDPALFRQLLDINLTGSFLVSQAAAQYMMSADGEKNKKKKEQEQEQDSSHVGGGGGGGGSIIFLSSIAGSRVLHPQQQCAYNASKAGVSQLARSLAAEWAPHGIRVNTIAPGYMDTALNREALLEEQKEHWCRMTPMGRLGRPAELNGLAVFLASDAAGFVTGAEVLCDGGYACY